MTRKVHGKGHLDSLERHVRDAQETVDLVSAWITGDTLGQIVGFRRSADRPSELTAAAGMTKTTVRKRLRAVKDRMTVELESGLASVPQPLCPRMEAGRTGKRNVAIPLTIHNGLSIPEREEP